jgi:hypothetical protein
MSVITINEAFAKTVSYDGTYEDGNGKEYSFTLNEYEQDTGMSSLEIVWVEDEPDDSENIEDEIIEKFSSES